MSKTISLTIRTSRHSDCCRPLPPKICLRATTQFEKREWWKVTIRWRRREKEPAVFAKSGVSMWRALTAHRLGAVFPRPRLSLHSTWAQQTKRQNGTLKKILWRCAWVPYGLLSIIPIGLGAMGTYHFCRGDKRHGRGHFFYSLTGWLALPLSVPVLLGAPIVWCVDWEKRTFMNQIQQLWARTTTLLFFKTIVTGNEQLVKLKGRPAVFVSNHQSWLDAYALMWVDDMPLKVVLKRELLWIPVVGWVMALIGHIPFNRKNKESGKEVIQHCKHLLENDVPVFLFPEGTRSKDGKLGPFKYGAFVLAVDQGVPIVPIIVEGTRDMMPPGDELSLGDANVYVHVNPAIYPKDGETAKELMERVYAVMKYALKE